MASCSGVGFGDICVCVVGTVVLFTVAVRDHGPFFGSYLRTVLSVWFWRWTVHLQVVCLFFLSASKTENCRENLPVAANRQRFRSNERFHKRPTQTPDRLFAGNAGRVRDFRRTSGAYRLAEPLHAHEPHRPNRTAVHHRTTKRSHTMLRAPTMTPRRIVRQ